MGVVGVYVCVCVCVGGGVGVGKELILCIDKFYFV